MPWGNLAEVRAMASKRLRNMLVGIAWVGTEEQDSLDNLEVTVLELLRTVFEILLHPSLDLMRSIVLTPS